MAITLKQITGKIVIPGTTIGIRATVTATPMTNAQALTFPNDDTISWGPVVATTDPNGVLPASFKIPTNSAQQAQDLLWRFTAEPIDKHGGLPKSWLMGHYEITGTGTIGLDDLINVDITAIPTAVYIDIQTNVAAASTAATSASASATTASAAASTASGAADTAVNAAGLASEIALGDAAAALAAADLDPDSDFRVQNDARLGLTYAKARNLEDQLGVDPTGATDCATAIQAAIDAADAAGVPLVSRGGFYKIATGITIKNHCDLSRAVFDYTGTTGTAITVGVPATITRKTIRLPFLNALAKTVVGWGEVAGTVGVKILNATSCPIHVPNVTNFETGVLLYGNGSGVAWNEVHLGNIVNNKVNLKFDADATGFTNQNNFHGGRFNHESAEGALASGTRHILMANSTHLADGNNFHGTSLESTGVVEEIIESYGTYNEWRGCRWESVAPPGSKKVHWRGTAKGNVIDGGYEAELLTVVADAGTKNNEIRSPFVDQTIWVPATGMALSNGAPTITQVAGVTNWNLRDGFSDEVSAEVLIPAGWTKVDVSVAWFSTNGAAGNIRFGGKYQAHADGSSVGFSGWTWFSTQPAPAVRISAVPVMGAGITVTPGPAHFTVAREGADGLDTSAGDIGILGIRLDRVA